MPYSLRPDLSVTFMKGTIFLKISVNKKLTAILYCIWVLGLCGSSELVSRDVIGCSSPNESHSAVEADAQHLVWLMGKKDHTDVGLIPPSSAPKGQGKYGH